MKLFRNKHIDASNCDSVKNLELYLKQECFNDYTFSIGNFGRKMQEGFLLDFNGQKYQYYYVERGQKDLIKEFENEEDACKYVFEKLSNSKDGRRHCVGFTKSEKKHIEICNKLDEKGLNYETDSIPYSSSTDLRYRIFVFGCDIQKVKNLKVNF